MALHQLGVVDYLRQPKAGYYALQRAYQPILPSIEPVTASWRQEARRRCACGRLTIPGQPARIAA